MQKSYIAVLIALVILFAGLGVVAMNMHPQPAACKNCTVNNTTVKAISAPKIINVTTSQATVNATERDRLNTKMIYFYQHDCPYCTQMEPTMQQLARENYSITYVNLTLDPNGKALVAQYGITSTPTLIIENSVTHKNVTLAGVYTHGMIVEDILQIGG
jgi:thiol-disulfide isomerase/thioredoxin